MDEDSKPPEEGFYLRSNRLGMKLQSITEIIIKDSWKEKSVRNIVCHSVTLACEDDNSKLVGCYCC